MPDLPDTGTLIVLMSFLGGFASVLAVGLPFLRRDPRHARLKAVARHRAELSRQLREELAQQRARARPQAHVDLMKALLERFKLENMTASKELRQKLAAAGWRGPSTVITFVFSRFALAIGGAFLAFVMLSLSETMNYALPMRFAIALGVGAIGFYLPNAIVKNAAQKRQQAMTASFPDTLDLMVICVEAGLSVEGAFARVTEEIADGAPVLSQEIGLMTAELAFLGDRTKAYHNFAERTGLPAAKSLSTTLSQSEKYGTPVSVALKVLSQENRDDRMAKIEKKAASLPAKLTVPMIAFFLPVLFAVIIGPAIIQIRAGI